MSLFVALGGSAYAVSKIDGSSIRNGSISGRKVQKNTLTGKQIKESSLSQVKSAVTSATTEQLKVTGVGNIRGALAAAADSGTLVELSVGESSQLLASGPFSVNASCIEIDGEPRMRIVATTTEPGSWSSYSGALEPDKPSSFRTDEDGSARLGLGVPVMLAAPSRATLHIGSTAYGTQLFGADCVASAFGVG